MENEIDTPGGKAGWLDWINSRPRLCLCGCVLLLATQISSLHYPSRDGVLYLSLARSLSQGQNLLLLGNTSIYIPPFYSLAISPFFRLSEQPFLYLSLFELALAAVLLWGVYRWAQTACPRATVVLSCMVVLNQSVLVYYRRTLKETLFMALAIWTVNLSHDLLRTGTSRARTWLLSVGVSLLICGLALTRFAALIFPLILSTCLLVQVLRKSRGILSAVLISTAVTLPASLAVFFWVTRGMDYQNAGHLNAALIPYSAPPAVTEPIASSVPQPVAAPSTTLGAAAPQALPVLPAASAVVPDTSAASQGMSVRWEMLLDGFRFRISDISRLLIPGMWKAPPLNFGGTYVLLCLVYVPVSLLCALGWFRLVRQRVDVLVFAVPLWIGIYIHATADAYGRLMNPLLPVLCASLYFGLRRFISDRHAIAVMGVLLAGNFAQASGYWLLIDRPRAVRAAEESPVVERLADFIRKNPGTAEVSANIDQAIWLMLIHTLDCDVLNPAVIPYEGPKPRWIVLDRDHSHEATVPPAFSAGDYAIVGALHVPVASAQSAVR